MADEYEDEEAEAEETLVPIFDSMLSQLSTTTLDSSVDLDLRRQCNQAVFYCRNIFETVKHAHISTGCTNSVALARASFVLLAMQEYGRSEWERLKCEDVRANDLTMAQIKDRIREYIVDAVEEQTG